jgi:hypothetical protein
MDKQDIALSKPGDLLFADYLNEMAAQINELKKQLNERMQPIPTSSAIGHFMGVVRSTGPNAESDYTDSRYWVQRLDAAAATTAKLLNVTANAVSVADLDKGYITATNISELSLGAGDAFASTGTHTLNAGTLVHIFAIARNTNPPAKFFWFHSGGSGTGPTWIKITSYATITDRDNAWRYSWTEQELVHNGIWQDKSGGRSSATDGYAYNSVEANNSASGMQGNSIDIDSLPGTITIQPVQGEPVVQAWPIVNCDGVTEWLFSYENAVGGSCS